MSIGESEAHKVVMTTIKAEETTLDNWDTTEPIRTTEEVEDEELFEDVTSKTPPAEGLLGSSLERPDGLQKELLAAIRRKISKTAEPYQFQSRHLSLFKHVHPIGYSLPTPLPSVGWRRLNGDDDDQEVIMR